MSAKSTNPSDLEKRIEKIENLLQSLVILQGARAGMTKAQVRKMVGVGDARVSEIWRNLKVSPKE